MFGLSKVLGFFALPSNLLFALALAGILLMATPLLGISLVDLANYLPTTDMQIINAVNLDGGGSTMMSLAYGSPSYALASFDAVPTVLAVYPR